MLSGKGPNVPPSWPTGVPAWRRACGRNRWSADAGCQPVGSARKAGGRTRLLNMDRVILKFADAQSGLRSLENIGNSHRRGNAMRALVAAKFLLVIASIAAWSDPVTAQNIVGDRGQTGNGIVGQPSPPPGKPGRNSPRSPGQFHGLCITDRGLTCDVTSKTTILPDTICHCGPYPGATYCAAGC